ncbi:hypothetical protein CAOG_07201 [Capsaspora owczarzaki ATCC 30864]|uniref:Uncharacterized protein n=1 Tax=Capsaspora owczarzaki (strain ATCC 30864) TaxID=595528 RepID=A0A0D2UPN1_CAPO3|nr:hypothetical protein CAOG_07201 [Capsaspora owczarzaki ATCC 30864]KJE96961.1 hypothetical protein CAOG_007201 [Capsaspora owczarzaki ATCC 30864]|eukprot:XP_004343925.2 hypothetical protein CAOG_07201 [Capsaspora owczarzaki ATCC 30864]
MPRIRLQSTIAFIAVCCAALATSASSREHPVCQAHPSRSGYAAAPNQHPACPKYRANAEPFGDARPLPAERTFVSPAVDNAIQAITAKMKDQSLAAVFANTLPNTLDTTVSLFQQYPTLSSYIITGDINAMWLRDSTYQVLPYLRYMQQDANLRNLIHGAINRQVQYVLSDVYGSSFNRDALSGTGVFDGDSTWRSSFLGTSYNAMLNKIVYERKYSVDSLSAVMKLSYGFYNATRSLDAFDSNWVAAMALIIDTLQIQTQDTAQEDKNGGPQYTFQRLTVEPKDSLIHGRGYPCSYTGMIKGFFRASDDAQIYCFSIPANAMAVVELRHTAEILTALGQSALATQALTLAASVDQAIYAHGVVQHRTAGQIFAYEVDGFGNYIFMDDAPAPSLLSLPYVGYVNASDPLYLRTRAAVLSNANPWYFSGAATDGVGGAHYGTGWIWQLSIAVRAFTSTSDTEILKCLKDLVDSTVGTGFMHEAFYLDDYGYYSRPWVAWGNSFFGDLILYLSDTRPYLIYT